MIDTDKYEGHTPAPWKTGGYDIQAIKVWTVDGFDKDDNWIHAPRADRTLAVDAPLLLAEVIRLREQLTSADKMIREMIREIRDTPREAYVSGSAREAEQLFVHVLEANWDEVIQ